MGTKLSAVTELQPKTKNGGWLDHVPRTGPIPKTGKPAHLDMRELERAMRFELTTPTLARLCSTPELRPL